MDYNDNHNNHINHNNSQEGGRIIRKKIINIIFPIFGGKAILFSIIDI